MSDLALLRRAHRWIAGHRPWPSAVAVIGAVTVAGCVQTLDVRASELAVLADRADRLAAHLEGEDGCAAQMEGSQLIARARDGVSAGALDEATAVEIAEVVEEVTAATPCRTEGLDSVADERPDDPGPSGTAATATDEASEEASEEAPASASGGGNSSQAPKGPQGKGSTSPQGSTDGPSPPGKGSTSPPASGGEGGNPGKGSTSTSSGELPDEPEGGS